MDIHKRLDELTAVARERMMSCSPCLAGAMGGAEIDFMTSDEKAERHRLLQMLPSDGQLMAEAQERIRARIQARKNKTH